MYAADFGVPCLSWSVSVEPRGFVLVSIIRVTWIDLLPDRISVAGFLWCIGAYEWCRSSCSALSGGATDPEDQLKNEFLPAAESLQCSIYSALGQSNVQERALESLAGVRVWKAVNFAIAIGACGRLYCIELCLNLPDFNRFN